MNRRDLLLQQMGIEQWQLHSPDNLKGAVQIYLNDNIRLVIISDQPINKNTTLFQDILRILNLSETHCMILDFEHAKHLQFVKSPIYWLLSKKPDKINRTLDLLKDVSTIWQSPDITDIIKNTQAKRQLWQQIQTYLSQNVG